LDREDAAQQFHVFWIDAAPNDVLVLDWISELRHLGLHTFEV
jgi:hypothetical protein